MLQRTVQTWGGRERERALHCTHTAPEQPNTDQTAWPLANSGPRHSTPFIDPQVWASSHHGAGQNRRMTSARFLASTMGAALSKMDHCEKRSCCLVVGLSCLYQVHELLQVVDLFLVRFFFLD